MEEDGDNDSRQKPPSKIPDGCGASTVHPESPPMTRGGKDLAMEVNARSERLVESRWYGVEYRCWAVCWARYHIYEVLEGSDSLPDS